MSTERQPDLMTQHPPEFMRDMLAYFYPVHYNLGMEMEAAMCQGRVNRKQSAMLWVIHAHAPEGQWVRRKTIEAELAGMFEISNSKISRMIHELAVAPNQFLEFAATPESRREKMVKLTASGLEFVSGMHDAAGAYLGRRLAHLPAEQVRWGLDYFKLAFGSGMKPPIK